MPLAVVIASHKRSAFTLSAHSPRYCKNGGKCQDPVSYNGKFTCECSDGWTGINCGVTPTEGLPACAVGGERNDNGGCNYAGPCPDICECTYLDPQTLAITGLRDALLVVTCTSGSDTLLESLQGKLPVAASILDLTAMPGIIAGKTSVPTKLSEWRVEFLRANADEGEMGYMAEGSVPESIEVRISSSDSGGNISLESSTGAPKMTRLNSVGNDSSVDSDRCSILSEVSS